jgi:hypothetical protein
LQAPRNEEPIVEVEEESQYFDNQQSIPGGLRQSMQYGLLESICDPELDDKPN